MHTKKTSTLAALLLAGALTMTACGGDTGDAAASGHNDADVTFAQDMIPHHAQAVQMSKMAIDNADSEEVRALAEDISAAQAPEIETMTGWLGDWDEEVPDTSMMSGDMGDMEGMEDMDMPGMMSSEEMKGLDGASGSDFDQMFLTMMIEHHEGAIEQAQTEQADGESAEAVDLAAEIEEAQTEEIATMEDLLAS